MTSGGQPDQPQRERVVLAHRRGARMVRTRVEVQEQTQVGDALVRGLVRAQLGLALRLAAVVLCAVTVIVVVNSAFPGFADVDVAGVRANWLILAVLVYPLLYGVGRLYVRLAEQAERDFVRVVDSEP
jgi:nucleoside permease NupC